MKKLLFSLIVFTGLTAFAGQLSIPSHTSTVVKSVNQSGTQTSSNLRSAGCDTLSNLTLADSNAVYFYDTIGYLSGNGAVYGGSFFPNEVVAEQFDAPASSGYSVSSATVFFSYAVINPTHADSSIVVKAYVYDTTGANGIPGYSPGYSPGNAIDSASVTLASIAAAVNQVNNTGFIVPTTFTFNNVNLQGAGFFIGVGLPQTTGDTIVIFTNDATTNDGRGWVELSAGWLAYDSFFGVKVGNFIIPVVCGSACPTITVSASEISNTTGASATASGGVAPYTYSWSGGQASASTDSVTGLTNHDTYTVTATDHNGCTGTATVSISTGIAEISAGIANFGVYPNPSNGSFTAAISLTQASDVTISIADMTGAKVYETSETNVQNINKQINLGSVAAGIYVVSVKTAQGTINQRIAVN